MSAGLWRANSNPRTLRQTLLQRPRRLLISVALLLLFLLYLLIPCTPSYLPASPSGPTKPLHIQSSVVIPAYHERPNIRPLVERTFAALREPASAEVVIVDDDSRDGTEEEVQLLKSEGFEVVLIARKGESGLSSAVLRGFEKARGEKLVVMDADLQHPPESVQSLLDALDDPATPFALGTRYAPGVEMDRAWPAYRRLISWGARILARPLTSASDPMSGFFGLKKEYFLRTAPLNPTGFKLALELLLKTPLPSTPPHRGIAEVPYSFGTRAVGTSKLSSKVMARYVGQLAALYWWRWGVWGLLGLGSVGAAGAWVAGKAWGVWRRRKAAGMGGRKGGRAKVKGEV